MIYTSEHYSTAMLEKARDKLAAKLAERDERIAESRRRAEDDRRDLDAVGKELVALYTYV